MRVPVYQQQVTPQIPSVRTQVQVPDGATGVAVKPMDMTAGIAQGVEGLRLGLVKMQENREQFELAQAVTEFRRRNTEFLNAKDTGVFAQQGENVFGSTERYTKFATDLADELVKKRKWSGAAAQRFMTAINGVMNYSTQSVMRFEQDASEKVKNAVFEGTIAQAYQDAAANVRDEALFKDALDTAVSASVERWAPFGKEKVAAETKKLESQFYALRIASILQDDPRAAQAMFEKNRNALLPDMQVRLDASIKNKMELIETQEMGDQLIRRFGSNEAAGLAFIRKNFEGEEERRYVAEFKTRSAELRSRLAQGRAALGQAQSGFYKAVRNAMDQGQQFTPAQLNAFVKDKKLSADNVPKLLTYQEDQWTRPRIEHRLVASLAAKDQDFYALPEEQQEAMINAQAWNNEIGAIGNFRVLADRRAEDLAYGLKTGTVSEAKVKRDAKRGLISNARAASIIEEAKGYTKAQGQTLKQYHDALKGLLKDQWGFDATAVNTYLSEFEKGERLISKKSDDYDDRLDKLGESIAAKAQTEMQVNLKGMFWGKSKAGEAFDSYKGLHYETPGLNRPARSGKTKTVAGLEKLHKENPKEVTQNAGKQK